MKKKKVLFHQDNTPCELLKETMLMSEVEFFIKVVALSVTLRTYTVFHVLFFTFHWSVYCTSNKINEFYDVS